MGPARVGSFHVIEKSKIWLLSKENFRDVLAEHGQILHSSLSQNEWLTGNDTHLKLCKVFHISLLVIMKMAHYFHKDCIICKKDQHHKVFKAQTKQRGVGKAGRDH